MRTHTEYEAYTCTHMPTHMHTLHTHVTVRTVHPCTRTSHRYPQTGMHGYLFSPTCIHTLGHTAFHTAQCLSCLCTGMHPQSTRSVTPALYPLYSQKHVFSCQSIGSLQTAQGITPEGLLGRHTQCQARTFLTTSSFTDS